jgi:hypothetical protein
MKTPQAAGYIAHLARSPQPFSSPHVAAPTVASERFRTIGGESCEVAS